MTDRQHDDRREPLWTGPPRPDDVVVHRVEIIRDDPPPEAPDAAEPQPGRGPRTGPPVRAVAAVIVAALVVAVGSILADDTSPVPVTTVPSSWGDIAMTCRTARVEQPDEREAFEFFTCRATRGGTLPAGDYQSPRISWNSDITRREARVTDIEISPGGVLTGFAAYS